MRWVKTTAGRGRRPWRYSAMALAGIATALLAVVVASAVAKSFTVTVAKNVKVAHVKKPDSIVANSRGVAVYWLSPETIKHPLCKTKMCFSFWPPVKVASAHAKLTKAPGVKGKLGIWHRKGFFQVTLNGHPLYTFAEDAGKKGVANGNLIHAFGGIWHVIVVASGGKKTTTTTSSSTSSSYTYTY
jgi:predicted lipoprotein with Yx(FWY)xxD motif